ncbi:carbon storage regulator CsrA [Desulfobacula phenolica]|uniref:Translational regulator CsrA n=1 Tax=Desulfobacula phenolica TaxID=90732 RepID=A0A1H2DSG3_9BACT|nr:carbon storage regulator CsrA [Desulfobacula phenolica]SDT85724.1 carbon storage regulator, CsrA [Desulfobacula phenolica]
MLILSRRSGEKIKIGDNIVVNILGVEGGGVKIGIDAPREVTILRMEVWEQIENENIDAATKEIADITEAADLLKKKCQKSK